MSTNWLIGLDRDGTLVPYAVDPGSARMEEGTIAALRDLSSDDGVTIAIVSARCVRDLEEDFQLPEVILAGNYGMEIKFPDKSRFVHPGALSAAPLLRDVLARLRRCFQGRDDVIVEDLTLSLCLHAHLVPVPALEEVEKVMQEIENAFPKLTVRKLPTSWEVLPPVRWDKGNAMDKIGEHMRCDPRGWLYLYIGDTDHDEPAFRFVNARSGISVRVGQRGPTEAQFRLESPFQVRRLLLELHELRRTRP